MRKSKILFLLMLFIFLMENSQAQEKISAEEIVTKYFKSIGGVNALKAITSKRIT